MTPSGSRRKVTPGSVILYRGRQPWPAVYLTDDAVPKSFLETRPNGYCSVILKLAPFLDINDLRWAQSSQIMPFDPLAVDESIKRSTPGLTEAYEIAGEAEDSEYGLDYWRAMLASTQSPEVITIESDDDDDDEDWSEERDIRRAIQMSLAEASRQTQHPSNSSTAKSRTLMARHDPLIPEARSFASHQADSPVRLPIRTAYGVPSQLLTQTSPSKINHFQCVSPLSKRAKPPSPSGSDDDTPSPAQKRKLSDSALSSQTSYDSRSPTIGHSDEEVQARPLPRRKLNVTAGCRTSGPYHQQPATKSRNSTSGVTAREIFRRNGLHASAPTTPDEDFVEDLDQSNEFVQVFVGPEVDVADNSDIDPERRRHKLLLMKHHVWDRRYFRDTVSARNYFEPIGEKTWELRHPRLVEILPDDFRWAAEFLSDGDFGHRSPDGEEQVAETFAQCISAWKTAEILNMDDLLERIVEKIRASQFWWDCWNVMAFACSIYESEVPLQAHEDLKALFSQYIAEYLSIYREDDYLSGMFFTRLKQLPELERDVLVKRIAVLEEGMQRHQNEDVLLPPGDDDEEANMDLYN